MEFFDLYYSQPVVDLVVGVLGLFPAGVLLAVFGWVISYTVYSVFRFVK